jgi:hypothetical protein
VRRLGAGAIVAIVIVLGLLWAGFTELNSYSRTDGGTVLVVRNGGFLDDTKIRQVLPINSPRTRTGWFSDEHPYKAQPRYYDTTGDPNGHNAPGQLNVWLKTADGINVGVNGQVRFTLDTGLVKTYDPVRPFTLQPDGTYKANELPRNPDGTGGATLIEIFDNQFGTRTFPTTDADGESIEKAPWDGDLGWTAFLDTQARPQIEGSFTTAIGGTRCVEINPACALVVQSTQAEQDAAAAAAASGQPVGAPDNTVLLRTFEKKVADALTANMTRNLGGPFFTEVTYSAAKIVLDPNVDQQIGAAQAGFAQKAAATAAAQKAAIDADGRYQAAKRDADAAVEKQRGYTTCHDCAQQDLQKIVNDGYKNLPPSITTLAGSGVGVQLQR